MKLTEKQCQARLIDRMKAEGYAVNHVFRVQSKRDDRWLTTCSPGFPDIVALREVVLAVEVKAQGGKLTPPQVRWLSQFHQAGALAWVVWPTCDLQDLANWLHRPADAPRIFGFEPISC